MDWNLFLGIASRKFSVSVIPDVSQYDSMDVFLTIPIAITKPKKALIS
jgi:hypothetical protein